MYLRDKTERTAARKRAQKSAPQHLHREAGRSHQPGPRHHRGERDQGHRSHPEQEGDLQKRQVENLHSVTPNIQPAVY